MEITLKVLVDEEQIQSLGLTKERIEEELRFVVEGAMQQLPINAYSRAQGHIDYEVHCSC